MGIPQVDTARIGSRVDQTVPSNEAVDDEICLPSHATALRLIDLVYDQNSVYMQLFHKPSLMSALKKMYDEIEPSLAVTSVLSNPLRAPSLPVFLMFFCIGIKYATELHGGVAEFSGQYDYFYPTLARNILSVFNGSSLWDMQGYLMLLFHDVVFSNYASASDHLYMAARVSARLGLHRKECTSGANYVEAETKKRALWTLVFFDRFVHSSLGVPSLLQDSFISQDIPLPIDDELLSHNEIDIHGQNRPPRQLAFNALISLITNVNDISAFYLQFDPYSYHTSEGISAGISRVVQFEASLAEWHTRDLPVHIRYPLQDLRYNRQAFILEITYLWAHMILLRPFFAIWPLQPHKEVGRLAQECINMAKRAIQVNGELQQYRKIHCGYFMSLQCVSTALWIAIYSQSRGTYPALSEDVQCGLDILHSMAAHSVAAERVYSLLKSHWDEISLSSPPPLSDPDHSPQLRRTRSFPDVKDGVRDLGLEVDSILKPLRWELNLSNE